MKKLYGILLAALCVSGMSMTAQDNLYVVKGGQVLYTAATADVDSVAQAGGKITIYDTKGAAAYSAAIADFDSITFSYPVPKADLLDVVFNTDGTATDASGSLTVVANGTTTGIVSYDATLKRNVADFSANPYASTPKAYYKADYESNTDYQAKLKDGHSIEVVFSMDASKITNYEAKPFASHQSGGTGFLICTKSKSLTGSQNEITFLPNTTTTGTSTWRWATSGVQPESNVWYDVVGVWNKDEAKAYIYVNGELKNTVSAPGDLKLATAKSVWWGIGCDANTTNGGNAFTGKVAVARAFDAPLNADQVKALYKANNLGK